MFVATLASGAALRRVVVVRPMPAATTTTRWPTQTRVVARQHRALASAMSSVDADTESVPDSLSLSLSLSLHGFVKRTAKGGVIVEVEDSGNDVEAFLPWQEAPISINKKVKKHETMKELMPLGLQREFLVSEGGEGSQQGECSLVVSAKDVDTNLMWKRVEQIFNNCTYEKENLSVVVNGVNKGGLTAFIAGYPVFVPISQLLRRADGEMWDAQSLQDHYMKKRISIAMLEIGREDRRVVCSEIKAVENDALRGLRVGQVIQGRVRKIERFGVFVGIQGTKMSALLHVSNISGRHVDHPEDVLDHGETVTAMIIGMDEDYSNISLSTAVLEEERGAMMEDKKSVYDGAEEMAAKVMAAEEQEGAA